MSNIPDLEITEDGVTAPTYQQVLDGTLENLNQAFGGTMNKDITTPQGQIAVSMAYAINQKDQQFTYLANQFDPNFAEGRFQDALGSIYFLERIAARGTTVTATCSGLVGTVIPKNSAAIDDKGYIYYSTTEAIIPQSGKVDVVFVNETTGAISCPAGSLNNIYKAVIGWDSIYNPTAGALGQDVESRNNFEYRRRNSVAKNGNNQNSVILARLLAIPDVVDAYVYSNDSIETIEYGSTKYKIPPHSLCAAVYGGDSQKVADTIFRSKAPGCAMSGNTTLKVYDKNGYREPYPEYLMTWLVPTPKNVYFHIQLENNPSLPADIVDLVKETVMQIFTGKIDNVRARIKSKLHTGRYISNISNINNMVNVESITASKDGINYFNSIEFGIDEMPVIDRNHIEVQLV